jgi:hypothetical protein
MGDDAARRQVFHRYADWGRCRLAMIRTSFE